MAEDSRGEATNFANVFDWGLKLAPLLATAILFVFTLYSNQTSMIKHDADVDRRLAELERAQNVQDREMVERLAKIDAAIEGLNHDIQFYQATRGKL